MKPRSPLTLTLACARLVLRHKIPAKTLDIVSALLSDFLVEDISLSRACALSHTGSLALLDLIWTRSLRSGDYWSVAKLLHRESCYYRWQFSQCLVEAVKRGDLRMVQWILNHFSDCPVAPEVVEEAARGGHLWALQLLESDENCGEIQWTGDWVLYEHYSFNYAAIGGHWGVVEWLLDHSGITLEMRKNNSLVVLRAYEHCNLERAKWAIAKGFGVKSLSCCDFEHYTETKWQTRTEIVKYILERGLGDAALIVHDVLYEAAQADDVDFCHYLRSKVGRDRLEYDDIGFLHMASAFGSLSVVRRLLWSLESSSDYNAPAEATFSAVENGNLKMVKALYQSYSCNPNFDLFHKRRDKEYWIMDIAAEKGYIKVLKFLQHVYVEIKEASQKRDADWSFVFGPSPECSSFAMDAAAKNGHYDVVDYPRANRSEGCTKDAMNEAAANGHVDILTLLHLYRLGDCTTAAMDKAATNCHYLNSCRCKKPLVSCQHKLIVSISTDQRLQTVTWLDLNRSEGCTTAAMDGAASNGDLALLQWFHAHRREGCTTAAMDGAAANGHLKVVKWLHANRSEGCTTNAIDGAAAGGHLKVLHWLRSNRPEGCTVAAMDLAAAHGYMRVVQWLLANFNGLNIISAMGEALNNRHFELAQFLDAQHPNVYNDNELREMRSKLDTLSMWSNSQEMRAWGNERGPLPRR
ncbi:hypothetical protein PF002_g16035 [Phytophthora fragariae]|uniref:Ankyrin repeat-containing domain n=2 Tax=Phytophthora fragariae TaxID=53985 RepID=A0A6A3YJ59_9STRA|nr:hypothetical protein PF003_g25230 [Phytophthora fragariae]KAE9219919.1 hypothetical protein PF002_g16035 [Phytophthora fragariae]